MWPRRAAASAHEHQGDALPPTSTHLTLGLDALLLAASGSGSGLVTPSVNACGRCRAAAAAAATAAAAVEHACRAPHQHANDHSTGQTQCRVRQRVEQRVCRVLEHVRGRGDEGHGYVRGQEQKDLQARRRDRDTKTAGAAHREESCLTSAGQDDGERVTRECLLGGALLRIAQRV